ADNSPAHYKINVKEDAFPEISILSPAQDLIISEGSQIKIIYRANDDFGISEIKLNYSSKDIENQKSGIVLLNRFPDKKTDFTGEYNWNIKDIKPKAGEIFCYFIEVTDNDIISGPKKGYSEKYIIEIFSYEAEHEKIENEFKKFREDLIDLLRKEIALKTEFENFLKESQKLSVNQLKQIIDQQKNILTDTQNTKNNLENILKRMEFDPYTNFQTYNEHKSIANSLDKISKNQMENVMSSLSQEDYMTAVKNIDEIIDNLERLNLISEDVLQYQTMQDLLSNAEKLNNLSEELQNGIKSLDDPKIAKELNKTLDEIDHIMEEINKLIQKMPKELPEEFINQQAVKQINTSEIQNISKNIRDALNRSDISKALEYAKLLQQQLQNMLNTLKTASSNVKFDSADSLFIETINKTLTQFKEIIESQSKIVEETLEIENIRQKKVLKKQEDIFYKLIELQNKSIKMTKKTIENSRKIDSFFIRDQYINIANRNLLKMENVLKEFTAKKIVKSKEWLNEIIIEFDNAMNIINNYSINLSTENVQQKDICNSILSETQEIKKIEQDILKELNSEIKIEFSKTEKDRINKIAEKQKETKNKTIELDRSVQKLSRKTSMISSEISYRLKSAFSEMQNAEDKLTAEETNSALVSEQKALQYLTEGSDFMQQAGQQISENIQKFGQPIAGFLQSAKESDSSGGIFGVRLGHVKLPDINEYLPPKEFREELLKSLKEKYPENYQEIIKQYYKKLTE
ncbi:MAG: DUF4175 family protein, partial [Endomicrobiia bacterium]